MPTRKQWIFGLAGVVLVALLAWFVSDRMEIGRIETVGAEAPSPSDGDRADLADQTPGERLCASQGAADSIRERIFGRAREAAVGDPALLTRLESVTAARIDLPRLVRFDERSEQAYCEGRLVLELPRGAEPAFSNSRRLTASLDYFAEPGRSGTGTVSRLNGADGIIDRLASADLVERDHQSGDASRPEEYGDEVDRNKPDYDEPAPGDPGFDDGDLPPPPPMDRKPADEPARRRG